MGQSSGPKPGTAAPRRFAAHLVRLVLLSALPLVVFTVAMVAWFAIEQRDRVLDSMDATSRALQLAIDRELRLTVDILETLAAGGAVAQALDAGPGGPVEARAPLHEQLGAAVARRSGGIATIALLNADGAQVVNSYRPVDADLPMLGSVRLPAARADEQPAFNPRALFDTMRASRSPFVTGLLVSEETGLPFIAQSVPVIRDGEIRGLLVAGILPDSLNAVLSAQQPEAGYFAAIYDAAGIVVARSSEPERFVGELGPVPMRLFVGGSASSARTRTRTLDGIDTYASLRSLSEAPFAIAYVAPQAAVDAPLRQAFAPVGVGALLALGLFVAASLVQARRLTEEMATLAKDAQQIETHEPQERPEHVAEIASVRAALRDGSSRLIASEARLRLAIEGSEMAAWDCDLATGAIAWSGHYLRMLGLPDEPSGTVHASVWRDRVYPDDLPAVQAETAAAAQEGRMARSLYRIERADGRGTRWLESFGRRVRRDGRERFVGVTFDVTERRLAEERHALLLREVDHRAKNVLAVVQAVVRLTRADEPERYAELVAGRVQALARAHDLLAADQWEGADLRRLAEAEFAAYRGLGGVTIEGEPVRLAPDAVQPLSMVLHELATNAAKHGALSRPEGRVALAWSRLPDQRLVLRWEETGGPAIDAEPQRAGFGSRLIDIIVRDQLHGSVTMHWRPSGLVCAIETGPTLVAGTSGRTAAAPETGAPEPGGAGYAAPGAGSTKGTRVLLVEDEALIATEFAETLTQAGFRIVGPFPTSARAGEAIATGGVPDLAVLDVSIAGGTTLGLAEDLLRHGVPVVFVTGYGRLPHGWEGRPGVAACLGKPVAGADLTAAVRRALGPGEAAA